SGASGAFSNTTNTITVSTNGSGVASAGSFTRKTVAASERETERNTVGRTPPSISLTNTAAAPNSISATSGTPQSTTVNTAFGTTITATMRAPSTNLVPLSLHDALPISSGASGAFSNATNTITVSTNASGVVSAGSFT